MVILHIETKIITSQVGLESQTPYRIPSRGGDIEVGFEVFPIDVDSRNPDGSIGQVIESRLGSGGGPVHGRHVSSLTSNFDVANPNSRQNQATYFEVGPPQTTTTTTTTTTTKPVNQMLYLFLFETFNVFTLKSIFDILLSNTL